MNRTSAHRRSPRRKAWKRVVGFIFLTAVLAGMAWTYRLISKFAPSGTNLRAVFEGISQPERQFNSRRPVILIVGKDYSHDRKGRAYTKESRADTVLLLSVDLAGKKLAGLSIPRDTRVRGADGITGKINGTFLRGGIDLLTRTLEQEFGVHVDHHVVLKADAVRNMVNAVGGVEVEAIDDMFYEDWWGHLKIDLRSGRQRLNGEQAVGFVRFRKSGDKRYGPNGEEYPVPLKHSKEEGDIRRTERQQQLIRSIANEALKPMNFARVPDLVDVGFDQVETDLSRTQVLALATLFRANHSSDLAGTALPGKDGMIGETYYWIPDTERAPLTVRWILYGDEMAGRQLTRVAVYYGDNGRSQAGDLVDRLKSEGYSAYRAGHARRDDLIPSVIYRKAAYEAAARSIADSLNISTVEKDASQPNAYWLPEVRITMNGA